MTTTVDRTSLAARQKQVLADLLGGRVPSGFDAAQCAMTSRILLHKRVRAASYACPELAQLPGWRRLFFRYAVETPDRGCGHQDMAEFARWVRNHRNDRVSRSWLRLLDLYDGRRLACFAVHEGNWTFVLGIGPTVWHLRLTPVSLDSREES